MLGRSAQRRPARCRLRPGAARACPRAAGRCPPAGSKAIAGHDLERRPVRRLGGGAAAAAAPADVDAPLPFGGHRPEPAAGRLDPVGQQLHRAARAAGPAPIPRVGARPRRADLDVHRPGRHASSTSWTTQKYAAASTAAGSDPSPLVRSDPTVVPPAVQVQRDPQPAVGEGRREDAGREFAQGRQGRVASVGDRSGARRRRYSIRSRAAPTASSRLCTWCSTIVGEPLGLLGGRVQQPLP